MNPAPLDIEMRSDASDLRRVRELVRGWVARCGACEKMIADVVLALDEALTNVIRHGYDNQTGQRIVLHGECVQTLDRGRLLEFIVRDWGRQVPLENIRGRDLDEPRPGGLGVHIIRALMDQADYSHAQGGGMRLVMRKYFSPAGSSTAGEGQGHS